MWWAIIYVIVAFFAIKIFTEIAIGAKIRYRDVFVLIFGILFFCSIGWIGSLTSWVKGRKRRKDRYEGW